MNTGSIGALVEVLKVLGPLPDDMRRETLDEARRILLEPEQSCAVDSAVSGGVMTLGSALRAEPAATVHIHLEGCCGGRCAT